MTNFPEKHNIGNLFDRIAGHYDKLNHLLSLNVDRVWRRKAVRGMATCERLLDVAVGTADLTIEVLRQQRARHIVGIDISQQMINIGADKLARLGYDQAQLLLAGALDMPFEDNDFDAVTCSFGVRNFSDLDKGLREMYRVLRKGGELMILEFSYPDNKLLAGMYDVYFSHVLPWVGRVLSHDKTAYNYLNRSVKHFIWGEQMCDHLRKAGFTQVQFQPLSCGIATIYRARK